MFPSETPPNVRTPPTPSPHHPIIHPGFSLCEGHLRPPQPHHGIRGEMRLGRLRRDTNVQALAWSKHLTSLKKHHVWQDAETRESGQSIIEHLDVVDVQIALNFHEFSYLFVLCLLDTIKAGNISKFSTFFSLFQLVPLFPPPPFSQKKKEHPPNFVSHLSCF